MKWTSLVTVAVLAATGTGFALVLDREAPANAATEVAAEVTAAAPAEAETDSAPLKPKFDADLVKDAHAFLPTPAPETRTVTVKRGDTLMKLLTKNGVERGAAHAAITELSDVYDVRRLQIGQDIDLTFQEQSAGEAFLGLALKPSAERDVFVRAAGDGFVAEAVDRPLERRDDYAAATIKSSLYEAALDAEMPIDVLIALVRMFSFDVDFQRDIQPGDSVEVLYDRYDDELGNRVRNGEIRFAAMTLSGKRTAYYRYTPKSGITDYFDEKGQSVRKTLMRTPVDGARLSSGYGKRRHPILGYNKMHRGVDFAAPTGTPIMAAGDGVVEKAGRFGAYGKYIRIRHNSTIKTAYAHLHGYARGIKVGARVKQGETIGFVGSTGRSTGPHLHYEVLINDRQRNPMSVKLPAGEKLKGKDLETLQASMPDIDRRLTLARERTTIASR